MTGFPKHAAGAVTTHEPGAKARRISARRGHRVSPDEEIVVVFRLRGRLRGPTLLVSGRAEVCRPVFRRLIALPSLVWLSGTLLLSVLGDPEAIECDPEGQAAPPVPVFDEMLFLDFYSEDTRVRDAFAHQAYWTILRKMTSVGMISGRGVTTS